MVDLAGDGGNPKRQTPRVGGLAGVWIGDVLGLAAQEIFHRKPCVIAGPTTTKSFAAGLSRQGRRVEATRFPRRTNQWRRLLPVDVGPRGNAYPRSACAAALAQISRPSTNPEAKSRLRRTPARRADALVLSANAWPLSHALPSGPCQKCVEQRPSTADCQLGPRDV